jgi:hypothetical protein
MVAAGIPPALTIRAGSTIKVEGAAPNGTQLSAAPFTTRIAILSAFLCSPKDTFMIHGKLKWMSKDYGNGNNIVMLKLMQTQQGLGFEFH